LRCYAVGALSDNNKRKYENIGKESNAVSREGGVGKEGGNSHATLGKKYFSKRGRKRIT